MKAKKMAKKKAGKAAMKATGKKNAALMKKKVPACEGGRAVGNL